MTSMVIGSRLRTNVLAFSKAAAKLSGREGDPAEGLIPPPLATST
jgi:hypothetical protein